jgi:putative peptide zinc metalloprotease protein
MNLSEALDAALPEIPAARIARSRPPRLDPNLVVREDVLDGEVTFGVLKREKGSFFRLSSMQWQLASLFDGERSYEEIAQLSTEQNGVALSAQDVRGFAEGFEESDFWYKSPQEKNLALNQKLIAQRDRLANRKAKLNLAHIGFSAWDPDRFLTSLDRSIGNFVYSGWCALAVVVLFAFEGVVFTTYWSVIEPDAVLYYNFTHKTALDLVQFWILFLFLGFIHETAHGLTCKHYGGEVHSMGLMFLYLMPAFFCDVTEVWVSASKLQRLATIIAGIWAEMTICGIGMIVWLSTQSGDWIHDLAYQVILITGIAVIFMNLNPLIKLDGYYFLTEALEIPDLKERSTAFLSGWFQTHILRLPTPTPVIPRRRAPLFIVYAFVSGVYSYFVLFIVVRLTYNIASKWMAEWALIPAAAIGLKVFGSRLRSLRKVLATLWSKHKLHILRPQTLALALILAVLMFVPLFRDQEHAWYVVEPQHSATVHAAVPGHIDSVLVHEGERVRAGQPMITLSSPFASALTASADALTSKSRYRAFDAELQGQSIGGASANQLESQHSVRIAKEAQSSRIIDAPFDGVVLTHDPSNLQGQEVVSGQELLSLADSGPRLVRIFVPAPALPRIPPSAEVEIDNPHVTLTTRPRPALNSGDLKYEEPARRLELPTLCRGVVFFCSELP